MTEVSDHDEDTEGSEQQIKEDIATTTMRSESSQETSDANGGVRRGHVDVDRQARHKAEKVFAQMERNWDKYMFEHLDQNTAKFIILKTVQDGM